MVFESAEVAEFHSEVYSLESAGGWFLVMPFIPFVVFDQVEYHLRSIRVDLPSHV